MGGGLMMMIVVVLVVLVVLVVEGESFPIGIGVASKIVWGV